MAAVSQYVNCRAELMKFIDENNCAPIMVRLAWHDSGNFDKRIGSFPERGGANGSIIHEPEISYGANAGLTKAVNFLKPFKQKYPGAAGLRFFSVGRCISWADLIQMASACAIQVTGGPILPMRYGRVDVKDGANIFNRMGFDDEGIVALSGAHTLGRAFQEKLLAASSHTKSGCPVRHDGKAGVGMPGGMAWTPNWLTFDNSPLATKGVCYFQFLKRAKDDNLLWLPTDAALHEDPKFKASPHNSIQGCHPLPGAARAHGIYDHI
eukprot:Skav221451  [mRNA]  locus=scaffold1700:110486:114951:- [translate_table: standard]